MANAGVIDFDADLMCLGWSDFDVLNAEIRGRFPRYGGLQIELHLTVDVWSERADLAMYRLAYISASNVEEINI